MLFRSQEAGQVVWYSHLLKNFPEFVVVHTVKGFGIVNKIEIDVFLELSCFFDDPAHVGIRKPRNWSFGFSISPSNEYSVLIPLKIDWFDLFAVQGNFRSPPAPQFQGINFLALCLLYGPSLTTLGDPWEDHNLDCKDFCQECF